MSTSIKACAIGDGACVAATCDEYTCPAGYKNNGPDVSCAGVDCTAADEGTCCIQLAKCNNKNGDSTNIQSISDTDCGNGFISKQSDNYCVGRTVDISFPDH